ncbi:MAG: baseplate J/gp47 family protein [Anaerolineae bacterium]|nr:baseplate J/gp47 family protein [Anaerolineae bacterium]
MAWEPPGLLQSIKTLRSNIRAALPGTDPAIFPNNLYVVTKVFGAAIHGALLRMKQLQTDAHVHTMGTEALQKKAVDFGMSKAAATKAIGNVMALTDVGSFDVFIPVGTRFTRKDGAVFVTTSDVSSITDTTVFEVEAIEAGKKHNSAPGVELTPETPIVGLDDIFVDDDGLGGGSDTENDESLRERILLKIRNPAHGGSPSEYQGWVRENYPQATRVFVKRAYPAAGQVTVLFMMDDSYVNGIPAGSDVAAVQAILDGLGPSDAEIIVKAPKALAVDIVISGLDPDNPSVRTAIDTELKRQFARRAQPGNEGSDPGPFVFSRSWISEAIASASDEIKHELVTPAADVNCVEDEFGVPEIAVVGTVTFL